MVNLVGIEFFRLVNEAKDVIEKSIVRKVYFISDKQSLIFSLYKKGFGNFYFYILLNENCFFFSKDRIFPKVESQNKVQLMLRKFLSNKYILCFEQIYFDRIVRINFNEYSLILEFLKPSNVILVNKEDKVLFSLRHVKFKDREIKEGENYVLPPNVRKWNPLLLPEDKISEFIKYLLEKYNEKKLVQAIAVEFGLGKKYANMVFEECNIDLNLPVKNVNEEIIKKIIDKIKEISKYNINIVNNDIIFDKDGNFKTINEALLKLYEKYFVSEKEEEKVDIEVIEKRKKDILEKIAELERIANFIRMNLPILEQIRIKLLSGEKIEGVERKGTKFVINNIEFDIYRKISEQMNEYFEKIKKLREKLESLDKYLLERKKKSKIRIKESGKWYEKFRYFKTTEGFIAVGGKDAKQNEILIKKYMEKEDLVFHANIHGSPFVLLKKGQKAGENSIEEAARFCACYSQAWKLGLKSIDVFYVKPEQVSESPPSGEYLRKGSFMIYGEKNWVKDVDLFIIVGVKNNEVVWGFSDKIKLLLDKFVKIIPGNKSKEELARELEEKLNIDRRDLLKILPGDGEVIEEKL